MKNKKISLIGMMGTGKTSVAKYLSPQLNIKYCDLDQHISRENDLSITEIFSKYGEEYFRDLEENAIKEIINSYDNIILSCGGGSFIRQSTRNMLLNETTVFCLSASAQTIYDRIKNDNNRPLLASNKSIIQIQNIIAQRADSYNLAHYRIATDNKEISLIAKEIVEKITITK